MRSMPLVVLAFNAIVAIVAGLVGGCAHDTGYGALQTTWDQSSATTSSASATSASAASAPAAHEKKLTAREAAAAFRNASECIADAKAYWGKDPHAGEALLLECAHRDDAVELDAVLRGPWASQLAKSERFQLVVAEVIAHRGGFVESDTRAARAAGIPIDDVGEAMKAGRRGVGRVVLVRGNIGGVSTEAWGKGKSRVAKIAESTWADDSADDGGPIPVRDAVEASGRVVFARLGDLHPETDRALVVAMRLEGPRTWEDGEGDEQQSILGVAVGVFPTGDHLRQ